MNFSSSSETTDVQAPDMIHHDKVRSRIDKLSWILEDNKKRLQTTQKKQQKITDFLDLAPEVSDALKTLSSELFEQDLRVLESKMTIALQEVLKQPVKFRATTGFKGNVATVDFSIERAGYEEDLKRGQGGSVHNILSVGLRMFAITMLAPNKHRRFLMLDEQDCWLHPELVPSLVKIVHQAGSELGYQIIMISHHDLQLFENYADRIYRFEPGKDSVTVTCVDPPASQHD